MNVIPPEAEAYFDIRFPPAVPPAEMEEKLREWTKEEGLTVEFLRRHNADKVRFDGPEPQAVVVRGCKVDDPLVM